MHQGRERTFNIGRLILPGETNETIMNEQIRINWYRCKADKAAMSVLMKSSDAKAFRHVFLQLALFALTGTLAYMSFLNINAANWTWSAPLLAAALFVHGTFSSFLGGGIPMHELCHKTPFRTKMWNEVFLRLYCFLGWNDFVSYRVSHVKHHQFTVHKDHDGEVVLPQKLDWDSVRFVISLLTINPKHIFGTIRGFVRAAGGDACAGIFFQREWMERLLPTSSTELRAQHRNWARIVLFGHLLLAAIFIATGHWFLIVVVNLGAFYAGWLTMLCGAPQHIGMSPDVPDFRLCCRTYTCSWLPAFLYWNMQYHVEHHMFPSVPFYNLGRLRKLIEYDLPPAPHGLWATWKEIIAVLKKQREDATYVFVPKLPRNQGERTSDSQLWIEAARES